jgi:hypothetical protein
VDQPGCRGHVRLREASLTDDRLEQCSFAAALTLDL